MAIPSSTESQSLSALQSAPPRTGCDPIVHKIALLKLKTACPFMKCVQQHNLKEPEQLMAALRNCLKKHPVK